MTEILKYELIDKHLLGVMTSDEQVLFNQLLESDPEFQNVIIDFQFANELMIDNQLIDLKAKMSNDFKSKKRNLKIGIGLAIVGLIAITYILYPKGKTQEIVDQNTEQISNNDSKKPILENKDIEINSNNQKESTNSPTNTPEPELKEKTILQDTASIENYETTFIEEPRDSIIEIVEITKTPEITDAPNKTKIDPCESVNLVVKTSKITHSCKNDNTGLIKLSVTGGTKPYQFSIDDGKTYKSTETFSFLNSGNYKTFVKDANGCFSQKSSINIKEVVCMETAYVFNADYEVWNIPDQGEGFELFIKNRSGNIIFNKKFTSGSEATWDGTTSDGNVATTGLYIFVIKTNSGISNKGNITVTR